MNSPTLADVAKAAGVSTGTVSNAVRGVGDVAEKTAAHVREVAERLGYRPNAAGAILAAGRHGQPGTKRPVLAFLTIEDKDPGFTDACARHGYAAEVVDVRKRGSAATTLQKLWNEGVEGVLVSSGLSEGRAAEDLKAAPWNRFALVKIGRTLPELPMHLVRMSAAEAIQLPLETILSRGYRRIMVLLFASPSRLDDAIRSGIIRHYQATCLPSGVHLEIAKLQVAPHEARSKRSKAALKREVERIRPDAVLAFPVGPYYLLEELGYGIPKDFGFATTATSARHENGRISGGLTQVEAQIARAVFRLHQALLANERGLAENPDELVMTPIWHEGATLPDATQTKSSRAL